MELTEGRRRAVRDGLLVGGLIFNATLIVFWLPNLYVWIDATAWRSIDLDRLYEAAGGSLDTVGAFIYSPAAAYLFAPLAWLPWPAFVAVFLGLNLAAVAILTRRWSLILIAAFPPILLELLNGNIHLLMALAIWAGLRWPAAWAFVLLTKVTPGVGVLWFAGRREWRSLAVALGATAAFAAVSVVLAPRLWTEWIALLVNAQPVPSLWPPLLLRLPLAAALALYAGATGRAWLVPVACFAAMPTVWLQSTAILTASIPLWWERERWRHDAAPTGEAAVGHVAGATP